MKFLCVLTTLFICFIHVSAQLPANTSGNAPRVAIAGDSWAQYMADDGTHSEQLAAYGQGDKLAISETFEIAILCSGTPGPTDYAVSGSEAREWANEITYDYLQNLIDALNANPTVDVVILSIGGNDILAGRSGGGWYKDMDLDVVGSEAALYNTVISNTQYIMNQVWSRARPDIKFVISSYDYPNFNVSSLWCGFYACDKREDLSRDTNGNGSIDASELITDVEINALMLNVENQRQVMADAHPNIYYDNSMGLTHYYYGYDDGLYPAIPQGSTPYPQGVSPYAPGGDASTPTDRDNFRLVGVLCLPGLVPADPIHLDAGTYRYKVKNQLDQVLFDLYRGQPTTTFWSEDANDGYVDVIGGSVNTAGIRVGDDGPFCCFGGADNDYRGILSFDTGSLPDNASITGASIYMMRSSVNDNPFNHSDRDPTLDIKNGFFGSSAGLELADGSAVADATNIGYFHGNADENKHAVRIDIDPAALTHINKTGQTQFRFYFDFSDWSAEYINFYDGGGTAALLPEDVSKQQEQIYFSNRTVTKRLDENENEELVREEFGDVIQPQPGYVIEEKLLETTYNEDNTITERYKSMLVLEHAGLSKYMLDNFAAPGNGLAPFLDVQYAIILPLDLLDFKAEGIGDHVQLDWTTSNEIDMNGFEIQHQTENMNWESIGFVESIQSNGVYQSYQFIHDNPTRGSNYYRLKMVNKDGSSRFSSVQLVGIDDAQVTVSIGPNPFSDYVDITISNMNSDLVQIQLVNIVGRVVYQEDVRTTQHRIRINLQQLNRGVYTLLINQRDFTQQTKLIKY